MFLVSESFFEQFDAANGRVEVKEDCERKSQTYNDDPRHEAVEARLNNVGPNLLKMLSKPCLKDKGRKRVIFVLHYLLK